MCIVPYFSATKKLVKDIGFVPPVIFKALGSFVGFVSSYIVRNSGNKLRKENAFLVNNTNDSYYVKFAGTLLGNQENMYAVPGDYNYFIGIVRPGQIISIPMSSGGTLISVKVEDSGIFDVSTISRWHTNAKAQMQRFFALDKTI